MTVEPIPFAESAEWSLHEGSIRHRTGGFFSLEGLQANAQAQIPNGWEQPIINQPEVGILGLVATPGDGGHLWLFQAKGEPGNVGGVQLGPTVQATYSNYMRRHGGAATHYLELFLGNEDNLASNGLHSEQGTRFLQKFNRNAICVARSAPVPANEQFAWIQSASVREALLTDFAVNTDARSVLVTGPWALLADDGQPFSTTSVQLGVETGAAFAESYLAPVDRGLMDRAAVAIHDLAGEIGLACDKVSLEGLSGWGLTADSLASADDGGAFTIQHYRVSAPDREKTHWDQPLVRSTGTDEVILFCQQRDGMLRFLLRPSIEVGLKGGVEIGPSFKRESLVDAPVWLQRLADEKPGATLWQNQQSDEGGRFMDSRCSYVLHQLPEGALIDENDPWNFWFTLAELEQVCRTESSVTNECRSAVSLLLGFA
ncbi:NDP-hexose 2,3-dehydratase family protein [Gimibacter soli]|uniref:NDP-hexose 2,3-dehydratase family protein n=1 Tax=Gimibacter soli TaxID=3024400 RepID=A0AAE9XR62_9PROT|nr:NDP-hexose 2,3-dehydratase family protein [Gimibacter soli]WCL55793.1 NDP-hexose 2,3-dehydratase family protein [Gimibacter soli]